MNKRKKNEQNKEQTEERMNKRKKNEQNKEQTKERLKERTNKTKKKDQNKEQTKERINKRKKDPQVLYDCVLFFFSSKIATNSFFCRIIQLFKFV
jgi:hypothetical protein